MVFIFIFELIYLQGATDNYAVISEMYFRHKEYDEYIL